MKLKEFQSFEAHCKLSHAALKALNIGVCVVTSESQVQFQNKCAQHIFLDASHVSLTVTGKLVCTASEKEDRLLQATIDSILSNHTATKNRLIEISGDKSIDGTLLLSVQTVASEVIGECNDNRALVILCKQQKLVSQSTLSQLSILFDLSHAETEICRWVTLGMTGREIASLRNVSYETVKSQTRSVLTKTRCKRRFDLIRLVTTLSHPLFTKD